MRRFTTPRFWWINYPVLWNKDRDWFYKWNWPGQTITGNGTLIHELCDDHFRKPNTTTPAITQNGQDLITSCQVPYILFLLLTQYKKDKAKYAFQTIHIMCPILLSLLQLCHANHLQSEYTWNFPFIFFHYEICLLCCLWVSAKANGGGWYTCHSNLWINSLCLFSIVWFYFIFRKEIRNSTQTDSEGLKKGWWTETSKNIGRSK